MKTRMLMAGSVVLALISSAILLPSVSDAAMRHGGGGGHGGGFHGGGFHGGHGGFRGGHRGYGGYRGGYGGGWGGGYGGWGGGYYCGPVQLAMGLCY